MMRLIVDAEYCMGCHACEVACKQEHDLPVGPRLIRVMPSTEKEVPWRGPVQYQVNVCRHCGKAPCVAACPTGALVKGEMGLVLVKREECIGCRDCLNACPFGVPQFLLEDGTVVLCDLCHHRLGQGQQPACVQHCPALALRVSEVNWDAPRRRQQKIA